LFLSCTPLIVLGAMLLKNEGHQVERREWRTVNPHC
jgi:hypothetical protein